MSFATLVKLAVNMAVNMGVIWASYWAQGRDVCELVDSLFHERFKWIITIIFVLYRFKENVP